MPEHLRALVVILAVAAAVFAFAKAPACAAAATAADFERRRNLWFAITLAAFLAHNFWVYILLVAVMLAFAAAREPNKLAMYFLLLFALPPISAQITGLGVVEHLFTIHYVRLLALAVLLPAYLYLRKQPDTERFGRTLPDKLIVAYLILQFFMQLRADTLTNSLRHGVLYGFLDVFLPYYVASRSLRNLAQFRDVLMAFATAALVLSAIGCFEFAKRWLLYSALDEALGEPWGSGSFLERAGTLRALASTGQPIVLGYVLAVAISFFVFTRQLIPNRTVWNLGLLLLTAGLIASLSRGPWLGAAVMLVLFIATGPSPGRGFAKLALTCAVGLPLLLLTPLGDKFVDLLPFVGAVDDFNVTYRQRLLQISFQLIMQDFLFGSIDYLASPAMQELMQGQGIIDVVNTYLGITLSSGVVGLSLFLGFFITIAAGIWRGMRRMQDVNDERYLLGRILLCTLLGILVIIFTVSSISFVPVVYWSVAGLGVAYARMLATASAPNAAQPTRFRPAGMKASA